MSVEPFSMPPGGMSVRKKWLIGCGGCLGLITVLAVVLAVAISMGWNALQKASGDSVKNIFGPTYDTSGYIALGLPFNQPRMKNMALLIASDQSSMIFAIDTIGNPAEVKPLQNGSNEQLKAYFKALSDQFLKNSAAQANTSRLKDIQFADPHYVNLEGGKRYPIVYTTVEGESKNKAVFMPGVVALIPQARNRVVALMSIAPKAAAEQALPSFKEDQLQLDSELGRLIRDSELDDRLLPSGAPAKR